MKIVMGPLTLRLKNKYKSTILLSLQEFMIATDVTAGGSAEDKLRWAFKMYDRDGSGNSELSWYLLFLHWF